MECNGHGFLEEFLPPRRNPFEPTISAPETPEFFNNGGWGFEYCFEEHPVPIPPSSSFQDFSLPLDQILNRSSTEFYSSFPDALSAPEVTDRSTKSKLDSPPLTARAEYYSASAMDDKEASLVGTGFRSLEVHGLCQMETIFQPTEAPALKMGMGVETKKKARKVDGQPSKNLMAERRRRKRLNDRLLMLRSVVPKISKMDRTSILGDTIDYMKELLERINNLPEQIEVGSNQINLMNIFNDVKPNEVLIRNSLKFDVERRNTDTQIQICCAGKPGLLLSTVTTLEALGLEIQQCVISCFNDFTMQASCSEELEQRSIVSSEDIKQALFRNAGYGGRCL